MHDETTPATEEHDHSSVHVVPLRVLVAVFAALLALTYITVAVTMIDLGNLNLWIALGIATIKGTLVVLFFMHLLYDSPFNSLVFLTAVVFMFLFLGIVIMDSIAYHPALFEAIEGGR